MSWIGVDFDGTLAHYERYISNTHLGAPVPKMVARVKRWIKEGIDVRIFTARADYPDAVEAIEVWCREHIGEVLIVTNKKDIHLIELWDDRAVAVQPNTGKALSLRPGSEVFYEHQDQ